MGFQVKVHGDSMEPAVHDRALVDVRFGASLVPGEIHVLHVEGRGRLLKRLWPLDSAGLVRVCSDNPAHPSYTVLLGEAHRGARTYLIGPIVEARPQPIKLGTATRQPSGETAPWAK